ncbi:uncharacterized protein JCM6883_006053 [Sporobolomyces salmoneus]|uniref:uncharacterized protein n=1 Tax=Sporobolomyces salmoneus TaxID=183962 RepID=UPI00317ED5FC
MKTSSSIALLALAAASTVQAQGIVDNVKTFVKLATSAIELDGDFFIQNAKTGKYLYFDRPGDTTNLITGNDKRPVTLGQDSQYGQSGVKWQTWAGTYIRGLEKCASSQWGHDEGYNIAAVSYACKVGGHKDGSDTLEVAKQFWKLVPCGSQSDNSDNSDNSDDSDDSNKVVNLNAKVKLASTDFSSSSDSSSSRTLKASSSTDSSSSASSSSSDDNEPWKPLQTQTLVKSDRSTWICRHPGYWLARHPKYVYEAGHVECKDDLENYLQQQKKRELGFKSHERMHKRNKRSLVEKRAPSHRVCMLAVDHSLDMDTRAITPNVMDTFGGYKSVALANFDESDEAQHWIVTSA